MRYRIPTHVHVCQTDDATVFLDLRRDRYFGIPSGDLSALRAASDATSRLDAETCELRKVLLDNGLLTSNEHQGRDLRLVDIDYPRASLVNQDQDAILGHRAVVRIQDVRNLVISYLIATTVLKLGSLSAATKRIAGRATADAPSAADIETLKNIVRTFLWLRPFLYVARRHCLIDSLTLLEFLARHGYGATWVLGIRTRTFAAHSWVQRDGLVLNDTPEYVKGFVPIAAF